VGGEGRFSSTRPKKTHKHHVVLKNNKRLSEQFYLSLIKKRGGRVWRPKMAKELITRAFDSC
jgi:hypothetical protein